MPPTPSRIPRLSSQSNTLFQWRVRSSNTASIRIRSMCSNLVIRLGSRLIGRRSEHIPCRLSSVLGGFELTHDRVIFCLVEVTGLLEFKVCPRFVTHRLIDPRQAPVR